jgi:hypothetical protein
MGSDSDSGRTTPDTPNEGLSQSLLSLDGTVVPDGAAVPNNVDVNAGLDGPVPNISVAGVVVPPPHVHLINITANLPDTPTLQCTMGAFIEKIQTDIGGPTPESLSQMVASLRDNFLARQMQMQVRMAETMTDTSRRLDKMVDGLATLVTRDGLHEMIHNVVEKQVGCHVDTMRESILSNVGGKLEAMQSNLKKLGEPVHITASTLGQVTTMTIPDLARTVARLRGSTPDMPDLGGSGASPDTSVHPPVFPNPPPPTAPTATHRTLHVTSDPPQELSPSTRLNNPHLLAVAGRSPAVSSPVGDFQHHNSHFGLGIDSDRPRMSPNERSCSAYATF